MSAAIQFRYFYGTESDMLTFYRIPKLLVTNPYFKDLSNDAKILYGLMLDRMSLSARNHWLDSENRVFIYFSLEDTMEYLNVGRNKAMKTLAELDSDGGIGLIERRKQGLGKPAIIYVKNFSTVTGETGSEVPNVNLCRFSKGTSGGLQKGPLEVYKRNPNKNNKSNTEFSENDSDLFSSGQERQEIRRDEMMDIAGYSELIKDNIEYDLLLRRNPYDQELIEGIYQLILETVLSRKEEIVIASDRYPQALVKEKFLKLNSSHMEYVISCLKANTTKVRNIKKYMLTVLFNAPTTVGGYYQAEVNHDMPQFAGR